MSFLHKPLNVRGIDFDVGFIDEAAFCKDALMIDGFFPVAMKKRSAIIMATTPGKPTSLFMNLILLKDENGVPKMRVIRSGQPCDTCMKGKDPLMCLHNLDDRPPWRDRSKENRLKWLYQGNTEAFIREQLGAVLEDSLRPFLPEYIGKLKARPLYVDDPRRPPECVFLAIDSACGGKCDYAIMGGYFPDKHTMVIVYMDAFQSGEVPVHRKRVQYAAKAIQSNPIFQNTPIVSIPENAPGTAAGQIHEYLIGYDNILTLAEWNSRGDLGVPATDRNRQTERMAMLLYFDGIYYSENLTTYPRELGGQPIETLQNKFERQLLAWERVMRYDPADPLSKVSWKWTAKPGAGNDDLAITGLMLVDWSEIIFCKPKYFPFVEKYIMPRRRRNAQLPPPQLPSADRRVPVVVGGNDDGSGGDTTASSRAKKARVSVVSFQDTSHNNKGSNASTTVHKQTMTNDEIRALLAKQLALQIK